VLRWVTQGLRLRFRTLPRPYTGRAIPIKDDDRLWVEEEIQENLLRGSWQQLQHKPAYCAAAFIVRNSMNKRRVVIDLRYINAHLPDRPVRYENLRSFRNSIQKGMYMISLDLKSGYHHVGLHPSARQYLGFQLGERYFQCAALPFGLSQAPAVFTKVMRAVVQLWRQRGWRVLPYLDDFLFAFASEEEATAAAVRIDQDLQELGLRRNQDKGCWEPTTTLTHLGLVVDSERMLFRPTAATEARLRSFAKDLTVLASRRQRMVPASMLAKFCGLAVSQLLAVPEARMMLRRLHDALATARSMRHQVRVPSAALSELAWWQTAPWGAGAEIDLPHPTVRVATDASDVGWGALVYGSNLQARGTFTVKEFAQPIMVRELLAVQLALESFGKDLRGRHIELLIDNQPAAFSLMSLSSRNAAARAVIARIWELLKSLRARGWVTWIPSEVNDKADALSRQYDRNDWQLKPSIFQQLCERWGRPTVDAFASRVNTQLPRFFARLPEPGATAVDGLAQQWEDEFVYANPPWPLIAAVVSKLERSASARATLVLPYWPAAEWYPRLKAIAADMLVLPTDSSTFRPASTGNEYGMHAPSWSLLVVHVSGQR